MKKLLMIPAALLLSTAAAAPKISAQSIIVNPTTPDLSVSVRVDKDSTGAQNPAYKVDDNAVISATVNRDAYVYLFNVNPDGSVDQILPNRLSGGDSNLVKSGTTKSFPAPGDNFKFTIAGPIGQNKVLALASLTPLKLDQISSFKTTQDQFATVNAKSQAGLAQALSIVVTPIPQNSWVSDTAFYTVAGVTPISTGSLFVGTNVDNATVTLNGQRLGGANVTYNNLRPGSYPVRIQAPGYRDISTTVAIRAGTTTNVNAEFAAVVVTPPAPTKLTISIRSSVNNARVFVDGQEAGTISNGTLNVQVDRGSHEIVLIAPGYRTFLSTYNVTTNGQITINPTR
ncbi:PEGA domain-containing protein [Deinococcus marmoris]|uniref:PEGA domain-containing protein n=1 Tax=Deinococcus marmoris TaxID=249408 RepID=UPI000496CFEA|nr:PEGA domain-containing protein [Deinococcus marmoris]